MSKVLQRKLFRKKYVQGFQAGGIVTLKKGGEANFFEKYVLGPQTGGLDVGQQRQVMSEFLLGPRSKELISQAKTKQDPESALIGMQPPVPGQAVTTKTETPMYDFPDAKTQPKKLGSEDVPKNQVASAQGVKTYTTGNKEVDKIFNDYEQKTFDKPITPTKPKDETPADPSEVSTKKQLRNIIDEIAAERKEGYGVNVPLMKLALGLMKGTTTQPGLAGVAQIFGQAGEGALDAFLEQEKRKADADMDLMELATKLKISQDEVASRKYAVDKQAELYGLKKYDPKAQEEALASVQTLENTFNAMQQIKQIIAKNPGDVGFGAQLQNEISKVAESVFGYMPSQTSGVRQVDQLIDYLQLTLAPELLKAFKPINKEELKLFRKTLGELKTFGSPQDLYNRINSMQRLITQARQRAVGSYDYNFGTPSGGSGTFFTDKFQLGIAGTRKKKEEEAAKNKK